MVPKHVTYHLGLREGKRSHVYLDHLGNPTGGVGHLMPKEDLVQYPVGALVPDSVIEAWLKEDSETAWLAAHDQAADINCPELQEAFFHVNFQLGAGWPLDFKKTWAYLKDHDWINAAVEAADSRWRDQTPVRCADFMRALLERVG